MGKFEEYLEKTIPEKDSLKLVKKEAEKYYKEHSLEDCFSMGLELYQSNNFQIQEVGVLLIGYSASENKSALSFLEDTVSKHENWKVQEILAMAFDNYCKIIGYEVALPSIKKWLNSDCANVRRAVCEGLRIWTNHPYFMQNPQTAIQLLSSLKEDKSEYVRKSVGNALRDISKKYPQIVLEELNSWDLLSKEIKQVYKLASKFLDSVEV
ncbi:HEAT repeat domain-containing protein [Hungatella effluvii]|uniref:HEAT repeat domain-containing protein n=1 Tax=Hungatella effluvii TaxID=1096246 RepID=UPI002A807509|nr:HEAT repeat domain-containing protein [Hungatella effluvii]